MRAAAADAIPADGVLLHIGPHKTGTTALQGAFHTCRPTIAEHGVRYAGERRQPMLAALAMSGRPGRRGDRPSRMRDWDVLCDDVAAHADRRVVVSSEFFTDVRPERVPDVVTGLGGPRVHVVVTLRPLAKVLPSQWQQYVQNGLRRHYLDWLDDVLTPPYDHTPTFWYRHRHDALVRRWADVVGPAAMTVIVIDESDRSRLMRTFESLLALPAGVLVPPPDLGNRSLTAGEVEVVRLLNEESRNSGWSDAVYGQIVRTGVVKRLLSQRTPGPDEPSVGTPQWALDRAAQIGGEIAAGIAATGVRVIGRLDSLGATAAADPDAAHPAPDPSLPASAAVTALVGAITASRRAPWPEGAEASPARATPGRALADASAGQLLRALAARGRSGVRRLPGPSRVAR